jgi:hypothetical protein
MILPSLPRGSLPLLAALLLPACGPFEAGRARLVVDPQAVFVPGATAGQRAVAPLTLLNLGDGPLELLSIEVNGDAFSLEGCRAPARLEPHQACGLDVIYTPQGTPARQARLLIRSDDLDHPQLEVPLVGPGAGPVLVLSPDTLDFGPTASGTTATGAIQVVNLGLAPAEDLSTSWPGGAGNFVAELAEDRLEPGTSTDLLVRYAPTGGDADQATLELRWTGGVRRVVVRGLQDLKPPE